MSELVFENFSFRKEPLKDDLLRITYAKRYYFVLSFNELFNIDKDFSFESKKLIFPNTSLESARRKFDLLLDNGLKNLRHSLNNKKVFFIDEFSEVPLIGSNEFGIVDRNTNIIELKPLTGCNFNCIYCSVDEGKNSKIADVLIEPYYLADEAAKLASIKKHPVEFNIGPHGEPLLYPFMVELVSELRKIPNCEVISVNTNGSLLSKKLIDDLKAAGLSRINLSLNSLDKPTLDKLSDIDYPLDHILSMIDYANSVGLPVLIAPLIIPTLNDDPIKDIEPLVKLAKTIKSPFPTIGFQKFLSYKNGRNPVKEVSFDDFFNLLIPFEKKYDIVLTPRKNYNPFNIFEDTRLAKPFKKGDIVKARIVSVGRVKSEKLVVAGDRIITVRGLFKETGHVSIKIVRDKHNIFLAVPV